MSNQRNLQREPTTFKNIPEELKSLPNWVCYRLEPRPGQSKPTKVPYSPLTGDKAKANDPSTWTTFDTCLAAVTRGEYDGIGFEFTPPYIGVDLDKCRIVETGEIEEWAQDVIAHLNSYTKLSPSGTGVHILCRGELPNGRRRLGRIEMYDAARFFTVTAVPIDGSPNSILDRTKELAEIHAALFGSVEADNANAISMPTPSPSPLSDDEIIARASAAANGAKFKKLWCGDWQGDYASQSEADQALCCHLAFWTGKDEGRIDMLFRQSGLYRQKWERPDYRQRQIRHAVQGTRESYTLSRREEFERIYSTIAKEPSSESSGVEINAIPQTPPPQTNGGQESPSEQPTMPPHDFQFHQTDLGNSERFILLNGHDLRYCVETGLWHTWDGTRWSPDRLKRVNQLAKSTVKAMYTELAAIEDDDQRKSLFKHIQKSESERSLSAMVNLAKTDPRIAISVEAFDTQLHLLNCLNGTIDLRTGALLSHRREDLITKHCPVNYDPSATSFAWDKFLDDCTRGDLQFKAFLKRAVGYTLFGDPMEQVIIMVCGPGGTGKSTFVGVILTVLGDYAATADFSTFLKKERVGSGPSDDIASLAGARLVSSVEVDEGQRLAEAMLKQITGGDTVRARRLYQASFEFRPQFALWLVCNHAPAVSHDDDAIWRRLLRLPFENKVPPAKQDKTLKATLTDLTQTGPAILAWAVKGCVEWCSNGLQVPDAVEKATAQYKVTSNPLADFVADSCILHPSAFTTAADIRQGYTNWCRNAGERELNRTQFAAAMRELGCTPAVRRTGRGWTGIGLQADSSGLYLFARREQNADTRIA